LSQPTDKPASSEGITTDLVEYLIIAVPTLGSLDSLGPALAEVVQRAAIRILDLVVVVKDRTGSITTVDPNTLDGMIAVRGYLADMGTWLSERDIALASVVLARGSVGLILVTEDRWAAPLSAAAQRAGGKIVAGERIPASRVDSALADRADDPQGE
jgi:hypothetical protein